MGMMKPGLPKGEERNKQKEILRKEFQDYNPLYHDAFVEKYNKQQDKKASDDYHKERGFQNGRVKAQQEIANKWPVLKIGNISYTDFSKWKEACKEKGYKVAAAGNGEYWAEDGGGNKHGEWLEHNGKGRGHIS